MLTSERPPPLYVVAEVARLAALRSYHILDTPATTGFDRLAREAALCMQRPMAAVSLVDNDRVWFKGAFGLDWRRTPRRGSFCEQTIAQPGPLVVPDAMADSRFCDHPDVQAGPCLRFYAGVNLEDEDGYRLGTVCVFDPAPGRADLAAPPAALGTLAALASKAVAALSAHRDALALLPEPACPKPAIQAWLGVRTKPAERLREDSKPGLIVVSVASGSPAERGGVRPTDILVSIDGLVLRHSADVTSALANRPLEGMLRLQVLRGGHTLERVLPIEAEPRSLAAGRGRS